jgi:hypothetical protein
MDDVNWLVSGLASGCGFCSTMDRHSCGSILFDFADAEA